MEIERINALKQYHILDTLPKKEFDSITELASFICGTPISLISLVDENRQWFKSRYGLQATETPREISFCGYAIENPDEIFIIPDSRKDERFKDNPLVVEDPNVIFYAGVPLVSPDGYALGTLCVIDNKPKTLSQKQISALKALADQVISLFELHRKEIELQKANAVLELKNDELAKFAQIAAHDIRSPLSRISFTTEMLISDYEKNLGEDAIDLLQIINRSARQLNDMVVGILEHSKSTNTLSDSIEDVDLCELIHEVIAMLDYEDKFNINYSKVKNVQLRTNKTALKQIFLNLIVNSIKYNDKPEIRINLDFYSTETHYTFFVKDNGPGINEEGEKSVFNLFQTGKQLDRFGAKGTGIGLSIVQKLVNGMGGNIQFISEKEEGTTFIFTLEYN